MKNGDTPAMPLGDGIVSFKGHDSTGLTKREYFAGLALQGMLAGKYSHQLCESKSEIAVRFADSLLTALEEQGEID